MRIRHPGWAVIPSVVAALALGPMAGSSGAAVAGGGNAASGDYPILESATVVSPGDPAANTAAELSACYNKQLSSVNAANYTLWGFDMQLPTWVPPASALLTNGGDCVDLSLPHAYVGAATVLTDRSAVSDPAGHTSLAGESAAIDGSDVGKFAADRGTAGPVLTAATIDAGKDQVSLTFDKVIDCDRVPPAAAAFGFYSSQSTSPIGASAIAPGGCSSNGSAHGTGEVTLQFPSGAPSVASAVRFYALSSRWGGPNAANLAFYYPPPCSACPPSPPCYSGLQEVGTQNGVEVSAGGPSSQCFDGAWGSPNEVTAVTPEGVSAQPLNPHIVSVSQGGPEGFTYTITYSGPLDPSYSSAAHICVYSAYWWLFGCGSGSSVDQDQLTVKVELNEQGSYEPVGDQLVVLSDRGGAVRSPGGVASAVSAVGLRSLPYLAPGYGDSDILRQCTRQGTDSLLFNFAGGTMTGEPPQADYFYLVDLSGKMTSGSSATWQPGTNDVLVQFPAGTLALAAGCGSNPAAVGDGAESSLANLVAIGASPQGRFVPTEYPARSASGPPPTGTQGPAGSQTPPGPQPAAGASVTARPIPTLRVRESRRLIGHTRVRIRIFGSLSLPAGITPQQGCRGRLAIDFVRRHRVTRRRVARLSSRCTYALTVTFNRSRRPTRATARFEGSAVLANSSARSTKL
jgi:hypothetical protein